VALVLIMVGLPARGKTYMARKIARYLRWHEHSAQVFNVGNYRRERLGSQQPHSFFDPQNPDGLSARKALARAALDDLFAWIDSGGEVAIYDATNITKKRRSWVKEAVEEAGHEPVFLESICTDDQIIESNIRQTKLRSPDYLGVAPEEAVRDFSARIEHYKRCYETLDDPDLSFIRLTDVGRHVEAQHIRGHLVTRIVFFLMNLHIAPRRLFFLRHGESLYNVTGQLGGDSDLSPKGQMFAQKLPEMLRARLGDLEPEVWTSSLRRTHQTAQHLPYKTRTWKALDEIEAGLCDGMTYREVEDQHPEEFAARQEDKLNYRYPRGESYRDVMKRLDSIILALERTEKPVVVIAHNAIIRCLQAWFSECPLDEAPHLDIPLHTIFEVTPIAYGVEEQRWG
jgi:broad specificity phosphatase PhoE